ncbi:hypothetical protein CMI45_01080 [Candidatus Pacearchaeota archaeon]|nr:hypothetical protein [Candidatus Pacearchaeota archaeon]
MYHSTNFDSWIEQNEAYYESKSISPENFSKFPFKNGLNKGDIILLTNHKFPEIGDIMVFNADARHPLIHRVISLDPIATKGDNNLAQLPIEKSISESNVLGKSSVRIPLVGWVKLIFFEPFRSPSQRGFCS